VNPEGLSMTGADNKEENWKVNRRTDVKFGKIYGRYVESWRKTTITEATIATTTTTT